MVNTLVSRGIFVRERRWGVCSFIRRAMFHVSKKTYEKHVGVPISLRYNYKASIFVKCMFIQLLVVNFNLTGENFFRKF